MIPVISIFGKDITIYSIMALIGIFAAGVPCVIKSKKYGIDDNDMIVFLIIAAVGILIGGHILYGITNIKYIKLLVTNLDKVTSLGMFFKCLYEIFGGSVFYGGLIGAMLAAFIYGKIKKYDLKLYSFVIAPFVPFFHFFGRIGCFLYGCCYGIESKIGFVYKNNPIVIANGVRRFPIQLVEAGFNLILFIVLLILQKNEKLKDYLFSIYLISYAVARFIFEFFRGDYYRGFLFGLSTSQIISIIIFIGSLIYIIVTTLKREFKK